MPVERPDPTRDHRRAGARGPQAGRALPPVPPPLDQRGETGAAGVVDAAAARSAFDNAPIGMAVVTPTGVITCGNAALTALLDRPLHQLVGRTFFDVTHIDDLPVALEACERMQAGGLHVLRHQCRFLRPDQSVLWVLVSTSRVPDRPDQPAHLIMHVEDISDRKALEAELTHRALHDPLTGLPNRVLLLDRAEQAVASTVRGGGATSLLFLDLNDFKSINDRFGHDAGDQVLRQFSERLTGLLRPQDTAARLGGDEFAVLCTDTDATQARQVAERLAAAAAEPFQLAGHPAAALSAAVGISTHTSPPEVTTGSSTTPAPHGSGGALGSPVEAASELLRCADQQMYQAKRHSRATRP